MVDRPKYRPLAGLVLAIALGAVTVTGCGSTSSSPSATPTAAASATPAAPPTASPVSVPSALTAGFGTAEDAIKAWLLGHGLTYSGDCETGGQTEGTYCSSRFSTVSSGSIYISGPVASEAAYWLLLDQMSGLWYVVEWAAFSETGGPPAAWS